MEFTLRSDFLRIYGSAYTMYCGPCRRTQSWTTIARKTVHGITWTLATHITWTEETDQPSTKLTRWNPMRAKTGWKVALKARFFFDSPADDPLHSVRDDDLLRLELARHF